MFWSVVNLLLRGESVSYLFLVHVSLFFIGWRFPTCRNKWSARTWDQHVAPGPVVTLHPSWLTATYWGGALQRCVLGISCQTPYCNIELTMLHGLFWTNPGKQKLKENSGAKARSFAPWSGHWRPGLLRKEPHPRCKFGYLLSWWSRPGRWTRAQRSQSLHASRRCFERSCGAS